MIEDFAVFILTHGRANNVMTVDTLIRCGYTGKIYLIIDNEDSQSEEYRKIKNTEVIVFDKSEEMKRTDTVDNFCKHAAVVYARNVCHDIAKNLNLKYFLVLDDDYKNFRFRKDVDESLKTIYIKDFDAICRAFIKFLDVSGAVTVAMSQTGDFIGGMGSRVWKEQLSRKAMNSFFCRTDRPFKFLGSINEDVSAYVTLSTRGNLFFTVARASLDQCDTQQNAGGLTDLYLDLGTYVKSFYSVVCAPSCVRVKSMGVNHKRIHHLIKWNNCTPKIISSEFKKINNKINLEEVHDKY